MKQRIIPYLFGILTSVLILGGFLVGRASAAPSAATGCFPDTNGHWAETFICWLKDNSITSGFADGTYKPENGVTRGEMSVFLQKIFNLADASAQTRANTAETNAKAYADTLVNTPPSGDFVIAVGPSSWVPGGNSTSHFVERYPFTAWLRPGVAANNLLFQADVSVPTVMYGHYTQLKGMRICYSVGGNANIVSILLRGFRPTNGLAPDAGFVSVLDQTGYTDSTCRTLTVATPVPFQVGDYVSVSLVISYPNNSDYVQVSSTSLILGSTTSSAGNLP